MVMTRERAFNNWNGKKILENSTIARERRLSDCSSVWKFVRFFFPPYDRTTRSRGRQVFRAYAVSTRKCINSHDARAARTRPHVLLKCLKLGHFGWSWTTSVFFFFFFARTFCTGYIVSLSPRRAIFRFSTFLREMFVFVLEKSWRFYTFFCLQ